MTYTSEVTMCPSCGALNSPAATVCGEADCGEKLNPSNANGVGGNSLDGMRAADAEEVNDTVTNGPSSACTCGGQGICTQCILDEYDGDRFAADASRALRVISQPANVVDLRGYSRRVK